MDVLITLNDGRMYRTTLLSMRMPISLRHSLSLDAPRKPRLHHDQQVRNNLLASLGSGPAFLDSVENADTLLRVVDKRGYEPSLVNVLDGTKEEDTAQLQN